MPRRFSEWVRGALHQPLRPRRGQAMILMVLMMPMLVGFGGLVVDAGIIYVTKARLQNSADAAALAGAQGLPSGETAELIACANIAENAMTGEDCTGTAEVDTGVTNTITVTTHREVPTLFVHFLRAVVTEDNQAVPVEASATVMIKAPADQPCLFPFFLQAGDFSTSGPMFSLKILKRGGAIDVGNGAAGVTAAMAEVTCDPKNPPKHVDVREPTDPVDLEPGASNAFMDGWDKRFEGGYGDCPLPLIANYRVTNEAGEYELLSTLTPQNCPRLIIMPILPAPPDGEYKGNEDNIPIEGYGAFWIEDYCHQGNVDGGGTCDDTYGGGDPLKKGDVWGYFVPFNVQSNTYTDYTGGGAKVVVMTG